MGQPARWYAAVLLLESHVARPSGELPLVEHQIRIIRAADPEAAYERALFLGRSEEHAYAGRDGSEVQWRFMGLYDLAELEGEGPTDGSEVYSFHETTAQAWRTVPKERLSIFWQDSRADRVARDLLG